MSNEQLPAWRKASGRALQSIIRIFAKIGESEQSPAPLAELPVDHSEARVVVDGFSARAQAMRWEKMRSIFGKCEAIADAALQRKGPFSEVLVADSERTFRKDWKKYSRGDSCGIREIYTVPLPLPTDVSIGHASLDAFPHFQLAYEMDEGKKKTQLYVRNYAEVSNGVLANDSLEIFYTPLLVGAASVRLLGAIEDALDASPFLTPQSGQQGWPVLPPAQE